MSKALLVLDMQEVAVGVNHAKMFKYPADLLDKVNASINNTDAIGALFKKRKEKLYKKLKDTGALFL